MNTCFLLNTEKKWRRFVLSFEKNVPLIPKNDVTEPKTRRLGYSNYQLKVKNRLKDSFRLLKLSLKLTCHLLAV